MSFLGSIRASKFGVGGIAAACTFATVHLLDAFMAAHGLHAEVTVFDDFLLSGFVFVLVYTLESSHEHQRHRAIELERANVELRRQTETVRELSGQLLQVQDEERKRFARELHDGVGQLLAAVSMKLSMVSVEGPTLTKRAAEAVRESKELVSELSRQVRTISHLMHPPLLDEIGLESALRWYVEGFSERSKIAVSLEFPSLPDRLPRDMELSLFRMVQEALTNVHRHSGSASAKVRILRGRQEVKIEVLDAGHGIPAEKQSQLAQPGRAGVGINGMRERIRQLGGTLQIQSGSSGTTLSAVLPLEQDSAARLAS